MFSNTLVLPGFNLYRPLNIGDPKKLAWKEYLFDLRGRHLEQAVLDGADLTKADLQGAQLQGASLDGAQLQGASLDWAQLQGASLIGAQLQGASLEGAHLQGAELDEAELQGASLNNAELQGASLDGAQLQGASLGGVQLQGASLDGAAVNAADFLGVFLWRAKLGEIDPGKLGAVRLDAAWERWKPVFWPEKISSSLVPWDAKAYAELRVSMNSIPEGEMRATALKRIERLDCSNPDKTLASCDPAATPPREVLHWQKKLARTSVDDAAYAKAFAMELRSLVCTGDANAILILRGIINFGRLAKTGREAPALVDFIMSKDCPVSASLTDDDKAKLLEIKQDAEKKFAPPLASKKEK